MIVREATYADIPHGLAIGALNHAESIWRDRPYDPVKLEATARQAIDDPDWLALVATLDNGQVIGYMIAFLTEFFFNKDKQACDLLVFVSPGHRGSRAALRLIRAYKAWAKSQGAREAILGLRIGTNLERTGRFYRKIGFHQEVPIYVTRF